MAVGNGTPYANATFLSLDEMKNKDNFIGFDFEINWNMGNKEYPYPVLSGAFYKFANPIYADNVDYSDSNAKDNSGKPHTVSDIERAFVQSVIKNSMDEIKPYFYPKADMILKSAYQKGEDVSILADLNCVLDEFYYDEEFPLGNDVQIKKGYFDPSYKSELTNSVINDVHDIDNSANIQSVEFSKFEYYSETYDASCTLIILQTENGAYLLAIDC